MLTTIKKLPIKTKLVLIVSLVSIVGLIFEGTSFVIYERFRIKQEMVQDFSLLARIIGDRSIAPLVVKDNKTVQENLTLFKVRHAIVSAAVYDAQGDIFARYDSGEEPIFNFPTNVKIPVEPLPIEKNYLYLSEPIMDNGVLIGNIVIRASLRELNTLCQNFVLFSALVVFVASMIVLMVAAYLQRIILKPIEQLTSNVQAITQNKDYRVRVQIGNDDEFGSLKRLFNDMLETIESYDRALLQSHHRLATFEQNAHYPSELLALESLQVGEGIQRVGGKVEDYRKQLQRFREHYANATQELKQLLLSKKDMTAGEDYCNTLKGVTGNIGAKSLYQCLINIGVSLKQSQLPDAIEFEKMQALLQAVIRDIDSISLTETTVPSPSKNFSHNILLEKISMLLSLLENDLGQTETLLTELRIGTIGGEFEAQLAKIATQIDIFNIDQATILLTNLQQRLLAQS